MVKDTATSPVFRTSVAGRDNSAGLIGGPTRSRITFVNGFMVVGRFCIEVLTLFHSDAQLSAQAHPKNPGSFQAPTQLSMPAATRPVGLPYCY